MTKRQARDYINGRMAAELPRAKKRSGGHDTFVCPFCGNGSGKDGTGISTPNGKRYTCFKGCFTSLDYLDILKRVHNTERESDIFKAYGLEIGGAPRASRPAIDHRPAADTTDINSFFEESRRNLENSPEGMSYIQGRGISPETARRFMLGYCPDWRSPTAARAGRNPPPSRRLIIPTGNSGYTARAIDPDAPENFRFLKEGEAGYFNFKALSGSAPVFIVEGAIDALSVCEVGGEACALGSTSGVNKFLEILGRERPAAPLALSLDRDKAGREAQEKLKSGLDALGITYFEADICGEFKDPNEHLLRDRDSFASLVRVEASKTAANDFGDQRDVYIKSSVLAHLNAFTDAVSESADTPAVPTGFSGLDEALDGGLYAGLYIIGAISSLGKTTFVLQAADQIAESGHDVLIFSLEMSRYELMAKSISRLTRRNCGEFTGNAKTTRGILAGARWKRYSADELRLIKASVAQYEEYASRIYIREGIGDIGAAEIRQEVKKHILFTGNTPVVFIDYLQIIAPYDARSTDKQAVDRAVLELKRMSRDEKIPVVAVSSFNRENYTAPVSMASFKESGAVEYSSDVLLGLQLEGTDELSQGESRRAETARIIEEKKAADPRRAQLKILKNRNGKSGASLYFDYWPRFNLFEESASLSSALNRR